MINFQHQPNRGWLFAIMAMAAAISLDVSAQPASPAPAVAPRAVERVDDFSYSWLHWWETAGWRYLEEAAGQRDRPWDHPAARRWKAEAVDAVLPHLDSRDSRLREQAVLALGRMGHAPLVQRLSAPKPIEDEPEIVEDDPLSILDDPVVEPAAGADAGPGTLLEDSSEGVRCAGWIALGLLDTAEARGVLLTPLPLPESEDAARTIGIGLLSIVDQELRQRLTQILNDPQRSIEVKRWAVWSLARHDTVADDEQMDAVLRQVPSPFVISQVLLADDYVWRRGGAEWLTGVLAYEPTVRGWGGYQSLRNLPASGAYGSSPRGLAMQTRVAASLTLVHQPVAERAEDRDELVELLTMRASSATWDATLQSHRGPDILALAMHHDDVYEGLELLYKLMRGYSIVPPPPPERDAQGRVIEDPDRPTEPVEIWHADRASRGYAAIGLGLMLRRMNPGSAAFDERDFDVRPRDLQRLSRVYRRYLAKDITDFDDPKPYRAACALALGLSNDPAAAGDLNDRLSRLGGGDELVLGYGLLGLALLGEAESAATADRYVNRPGEVGGVWDVLGRRAALQAVAVLGERVDPSSRGVLTKAWGKNPWTGLATAEAAADTGWFELAQPVINSIRGERGTWQLAGVMAAGRMFEFRHPSPLKSIARDANYTLTFRHDAYDLAQQRRAARAVPTTDDNADPTPEPNPPPEPYQPEGWPIRQFYNYSEPYLFDVLLR